MARIKIDLVGGPAAQLSSSGNLREVEDVSQNLKISVGGGYEHFSHEGEFRARGTEQVAIFNWTGRTKIAE
jgi:hypothetical protein